MQARGCCDCGRAGVCVSGLRYLRPQEEPRCDVRFVESLDSPCGLNAAEPTLYACYHSGMSEPQFDDVPMWQETPEDRRSEIRNLLLGGHSISAIKLYRKIHGMGLVEAKHAIEALIAALIEQRDQQR